MSDLKVFHRCFTGPSLTQKLQQAMRENMAMAPQGVILFLLGCTHLQAQIKRTLLQYFKRLSVLLFSLAEPFMTSSTFLIYIVQKCKYL